jgi:hypothetical protein
MAIAEARIAEEAEQQTGSLHLRDLRLPELPEHALPFGRSVRIP